jgi:hypothetical protein
MRSSLKNIPISISILHDAEHRNIMKHILGKRRAYSDCNLLNRTRCETQITRSIDRKVANTQMSHSVTVS